MFFSCGTTAGQDGVGIAIADRWFKDWRLGVKDLEVVRVDERPMYITGSFGGKDLALVSAYGPASSRSNQ